jgi:hypothetical protein
MGTRRASPAPDGVTSPVRQACSLRLRRTSPRLHGDCWSSFHAAESSHAGITTANESAFASGLSSSACTWSTTCTTSVEENGGLASKEPYVGANSKNEPTDPNLNHRLSALATLQYETKACGSDRNSWQPLSRALQVGKCAGVVCAHSVSQLSTHCTAEHLVVLTCSSARKSN